MRGLDNKVAVVTGGGGGSGRAIGLRLAAEGCRVGIFDINEAGAKTTVAPIAKLGTGAGHAFAVDISRFEAVRTGVDALEKAAGPIDILVNNAGWDKIVPFPRTDFALWKKVIDINLYGPMHVHFAVLPGMAERQSGKVIDIACDAGRVGSSGEAVHAACKGGIIAFTKTLARELARDNIQLNTVCPGPTDTPFLAQVAGSGEVGAKIAEGLKRAIPMRRLGQPDDYPGIVAFLASQDANFITGQTISVSGGLTMHG